MLANKAIEINKFYYKNKRLDFLFRLGTELPLPFVILFTLPLWVIAALFESIILGNIAAVVGLLICIAWFWNILKNQNEMLRFMRLGAIVLCIIQFMAWLTSFYVHYSENIEMKDSIQILLGFESSISYYCMAISFVILFSFFFALFGSLGMLKKLEINVVNNILKIKEFKNAILYWVIITLIFSELILILTGVVGQRSIVLEGYDIGEKPFWYLFYESFLAIHILLVALLAYKLFNKRTNKKLYVYFLFILSFFVLGFIFFSKGRSGFMFYLVSLGFWYIFLSNQRPPLIKLILVIAVVYPIISQILLFNNFIRSKNANIEDSRGSAIEVLPQAFDTYINSKDLIREEKARSSKNLATRPLVATPLAQCIHLQFENKQFMIGDNLLHSIIWALPGFLIPDKQNYPIQEGLLYKHFPIGYSDTADSIYLGAYTDFGWAGVAIYPFFFLVIWIGFLYIYMKTSPALITYLVLTTIFFQTTILSIGEGSVLTWMISFRTVSIFLLINIIFLFLFRNKKIKIKTIRR